MNDKWPHHWTMEPNLERIKENGLEEWLAAQERQWSCSGCGAHVNWYQRTCSCGQELEAWDVPE